MTEATPLASKQITQDQRAAAIERIAAKLGSMFHGQMKINLATELADAALSASPAPSGQGVSGEVDKRVRAILLDAGIHEDADTAIGLVAYPVAARAVREALRAAPAPSCAPGEVERDREAILAAYHHLKKVGDWLAVCAETTGGTAGPDPQMQEAVAAWAACKRLLPDIRRGAAEPDCVIAAGVPAALSPQGMGAKEGGE